MRHMQEISEVGAFLHSNVPFLLAAIANSLNGVELEVLVSFVAIREQGASSAQGEYTNTTGAIEHTDQKAYLRLLIQIVLRAFWVHS